MSIELINNLIEKNHGRRIEQLIATADEVLILRCPLIGSKPTIQQ